MISDPAGPLFSIDQPTERLHWTDADYVEVQFTDIGRLGFTQPIGHANFYPNFGRFVCPGLIEDYEAFLLINLTLKRYLTARMWNRFGWKLWTCFSE